MTKNQDTKGGREMKVVCAWCKAEIGTKEGEGVTHGICPDCYAAMKELLANLKPVSDNREISAKSGETT